MMRALSAAAALLAASRVSAQPTDSLFSPAPPIFTGTAYKFGSNASAILTPPNTVNPAGPIGGKVTANPLNPAWRAGDTFISYGTGFASGVASGDPLPGQIIIWTRFQPANDVSALAAADPKNLAYVYNQVNPAGYKALNVSWWLGPSASGASPTASGVFLTDGARDWTVKVDVNYASANAAAGQTFYYGFGAVYQGVNFSSPVGRFRAINNGNTMSTLNYAVASCTNYGFGLFNAYDMMAKVDNLDVWFHVGDLFYEYAELAYPSAAAKLRTTVADPPTEIVSLDDVRRPPGRAVACFIPLRALTPARQYRRRHRESLSDPSLQFLSSRVPLIALTDDHDYMNNAWMTGAENHQPSGNARGSVGFDSTRYPEGDYYARINVAMQSFYEYNPIREPTAAAVAAAQALITSSFSTYLAPITGSATVTTAASAAGYSQLQTASCSPVANLTALTRARVGAFQRTFQLGGLVTVVLAEDRLGFRTSGEAVVTTTDPADGLPGSAFYQQLGGLDCPACPTASTACLTAQITAYLTAVATNGASGYPTQCSPQLLSYVYNTGAINFANWTASMIQAGKAFSFAMETLQTYNGNNTQHIIGTTPAIYLGTQFAASKAAGVPFQVWASQTVFLPTPWPDLINATAHGRANSQALGKGGFLSGLCGSSFAPSCCACRRARLYRSSADAPVADNALTGGTFGSDNWDGFNTERNFITAMLSLGNTPIINSGDSHSFWLGVVPNVTFASGPTQPAVIEFGGGAITSPGWGDSFGTSGGPVPGYTLGTAEQAFMNFVEDGHVLAAAGAGFGLKTVRHAHGALIFQVNATSYVGQVMTVDTTNSTTYRAMCDYAYQVLPGTKGVFTSLAVGQTGYTGNPGCVSTVNGAVPGTFFVGQSPPQQGYATQATPGPRHTAVPLAPAKHAFDLTAAAPADAGAVGGWTLAPAVGGGFSGAAASSSSATPIANVTFTAWYPSNSTNSWTSVFSMGGVSLSIHPTPIVAAPGVSVSSIGVVMNQNTGCSFAFFLDGTQALLNGAPYPPYPQTYPTNASITTGRRLLQAAAPSPAAATFMPGGVPVVVVVSFSASGQPSVSDAFGRPFTPVPFPSVAGSTSTCAPASVAPGALLLVGAGTATAAPFTGNVTFISVA